MSRARGRFWPPSKATEVTVPRAFVSSGRIRGAFVSFSAIKSHSSANTSFNRTDHMNLSKAFAIHIASSFRTSSAFVSPTSVALSSQREIPTNKRSSPTELAGFFGTMATNVKNKKTAAADDAHVSISKAPLECMREIGKPLIRILEHGLPTALQTHELLVDNESSTILATQMEEGRLVRLKFDKETGDIFSAVESAVIGADDSDDPFVGMHGLCASKMFPGKTWVTLQYINKIVLIDMSTMEIEASVDCPKNMGADIVGGPHSAIESHGRLHVCLKGGSSCHGTTGARSRELAEEATAHALWRVDLAGDGSAKDGGTLFRVPPTPVICAIDSDGSCWVVTDESGSITKIPFDGKCTACAINVQLPYQYALYHQSGPGIQIGPDGNVWFCVLHGEALVGKVDKDTLEVTMFELIAPSWNPNPRYCHINWDKDGILYAISSDLLDKTAVNALVRIKFDPDFKQVIAQHDLALPTQASCIHRIAFIDDCKDPSILVSELTQSQILQVFKSTLPPLETFPAKTIKQTVNKVYDAIAPCPRTGNPVCMCELVEDKVAIPSEPQFVGQEIFVNDETKQKAEEYVDPRTGEKKYLLQAAVLPNALIAEGYPMKGHNDPSLVDIYATNGLTNRMAATTTGRKPGSTLSGGSTVQYYPDKLMEILKKEPARIKSMNEEIKNAGLNVEEVEKEIMGELMEKCPCNTGTRIKTSEKKVLKIFGLSQ